MLLVLPNEIIVEIGAYLTYNQIKLLINAIPYLTHILNDLKLKKARKIHNNLNQEMRQLRLEYDRKSANIERLLNWGHCNLNINQSMRNLTNTLQKMRVVEKKKKEIGMDLQDEEYQSAVHCIGCGTIFTSLEIAESHMMHLFNIC